MKLNEDAMYFLFLFILILML